MWLPVLLGVAAGILIGGGAVIAIVAKYANEALKTIWNLF